MTENTTLSAPEEQKTIKKKDVLAPLEEAAGLRQTLTLDTQDALGEVVSSVDQKALLEQKVGEAKENIKIALEQGIELQELDILYQLQGAMDNCGVDKAELPFYLKLLGMKNAEGFAEFQVADDDNVLSVDELASSIEDATGTGPSSAEESALFEATLDSAVYSVFEDYSLEIREQKIASPEALNTFLRNKWTEVAPLLEAKYKKEQPNPQADQKKKGPFAKLMSIFSTEASAHTPLDVFYNAVFKNSEEKEGLNEKGFLDPATKEINRANVDEYVFARIDALCAKVDEKKFPSYLEATKPLTTPEEKEIEKEEKLLTVPENHRGWGFETEYIKYIDATLSKGIRPKDFNEWIEERPKPTGLFGSILDKIKLMFINSGLGKFFSDWFGPTSFIAKILGYGTSDAEKKKIEEAKKKREDDKKKKEQEQTAKTETIEKIAAEEDTLWAGVTITDVKKENYKDLKSADDLALLEKTLRAPQASVLGVARTTVKGLKLESIKKLSEMEGKEDGVTYVSAKDGGAGKINIGDTELLLTDASIQTNYDAFISGKEARAAAKKAAEDKEKADRLTRLEKELKSDSKYAQYFDLKNDFPKELMNGRTIEDTLKSLLGLIKKYPMFVHNYKITDHDLQNFIAGKLQGKFDTASNTFKKATGNDYYKIGAKYFSMPDLPGVPLPSWLGGSVGTIGSGDIPLIEVESDGSNDSFENVQAFFDWLDNEV